MKTIKQVSDLTGISVRMLHYYDKIGLLKPIKFTEAGYRLYNHKSLETLQQILFFKELQLPLKEVKKIISDPNFDKTKTLENQKKLLILKRNRLNNLIDLINKTLKGENMMSFKEFDMSEYFNVLEEFKIQHPDKIVKFYGGIDKYNELIEKCKSKEDEIGKMALKKYGSIKKYAEAVKKNLNSDVLTLSEKYEEFKKDFLEDNHPKLKNLYRKLLSDLSKDPSSREIQQIAKEITHISKEDYEIFKMDNGDYNWYYMIRIYSFWPEWIKSVDDKYGTGASKFIGETLENYLGDNKPKLEELYEKLVYDLSEDPSSEKIQQIVKKIVNETKNQHKALKIDEGENHWNYTSELYLTDSIWIKATDKNYGTGASEFIGEALKFYCENNR